MSQRGGTLFLLIVVIGFMGCQGSKSNAAAPLTRALYDQIKEGMTLAQVEAVLGPGSAKPPVGDGRFFTIGAITIDRPQEHRYWWDGTKTVSIIFFTDTWTVGTKSQNGL